MAVMSPSSVSLDMAYVRWDDLEMTPMLSGAEKGIESVIKKTPA